MVNNKSQKILIIEDEDKIRSLYTRMLLDEGYNVIEAKNVNHGTRELLLNPLLALVLLDINLPDCSGIVMKDIIEGMRPQLKVIVMSVYPVSTQKEMIRGASDYYDKSNGVNILLEKIRMILKGRKFKKI